MALATEDIAWVIPGDDWPLAGTRHGHAGLADLLETASRSVETSTEPREFVAQGDRVLVLGFASGRMRREGAPHAAPSTSSLSGICAFVLKNTNTTSAVRSVIAVNSSRSSLNASE